MQLDGLTVFVVEDDQSVRDALGLLLGLKGYSVRMFADAESFLSAFDSTWTGCLLIDIRMPGMSGLELQRHLQEHEYLLPVVVMTGHGSVDAAREAFRADAVDFLEKPLDHVRLLTAIEEGMARQSGREAQRRQRADHDRLLAALTPREREVMDLVVDGAHNRDIAKNLGISPRTVEVHKGRMMSKLRVNSVPDLVKLNLARG